MTDTDGWSNPFDKLRAEGWQRCVEWFAGQTGEDRIPDRVLLDAEDSNPWDRAVTRPAPPPECEACGENH